MFWFAPWNGKRGKLIIQFNSCKFENWLFDARNSYIWSCISGLQLLFLSFPKKKWPVWNAYFYFCRTCFSMGNLGMQVSVRPFKWLLWNTCFYFCCICFSVGNLGVHVSIRLSVHSSVRQHLPWDGLGVLWAHLLSQFCTDLFETLQGFSSWFGDVHVIWI